jgi:hypothetical protein
MPGSLRPPSSSMRRGVGDLVEPRQRVLSYPNFRFGSALFFPDAPHRGPWRPARSHFRLILSHDFHLRHLDEPSNLPRPWGQLFWVPEALAHTAISRLAGHHFWISPRAGALASTRLGTARVVPIKDSACVDAAVRLYDEYQQGDEALSIELDAQGHLLIGLANRLARRGRTRLR